MKLQHSAQTDVGKSRDVNQDSFKVGPQLPDGSQLFVVCDGMGGHLAGEVASQTAVETLVDTFPTSLPTDIPNALTQSFLAANQAVFERGRGNMGTTAVALLIYRNFAFIANVGDSRAYLFRNGELRQVSVDHSFVEEQVRAGLLTREQAARSHVRNIITRAVGHQRDVQVDVFREPVQVGDMFMLCSDGLHGYVEEGVLADLLRRGPFDQIVPTMIKLANDAGGPDNITAIVVRVDELDVVDANDPLLAALLTQAPPSSRETVELPLDEVDGPTGTAKMPVMRDDPAPLPASPPAPPRERGLSLWGLMGALVVLGLLFGVLYWFNLPPVSLLFGHTTATPAAIATPRPVLSTPTLVETTPLTGTGALSPTNTLSPTLSPAQRTLTPLGTPGASPTP